MTLGQEITWAYSTMLPSPHGASESQRRESYVYAGWLSYIRIQLAISQVVRQIKNIYTVSQTATRSDNFWHKDGK